MFLFIVFVLFLFHFAFIGGISVSVLLALSGEIPSVVLLMFMYIDHRSGALNASNETHTKQPAHVECKRENKRFSHLFILSHNFPISINQKKKQRIRMRRSRWREKEQTTYKKKVEEQTIEGKKLLRLSFIIIFVYFFYLIYALAKSLHLLLYLMVDAFKAIALSREKNSTCTVQLCAVCTLHISTFSTSSLQVRFVQLKTSNSYNKYIWKLFRCIKNFSVVCLLE